MDYLTGPEETLTVREPTSCSAGSGVGWISQAWQLFKASWLEFLVALVLLVVIRLAVEQVPVVGIIASALLMPLLMAGYLELAHRTRSDNGPSIGNLFAAFGESKRDQLKRLLQLGGVSLLFGVIMVLLLAACFFNAVGGMEGVSQLSANWQNMTPEQLAQVLHPGAGLLVWGLGFLLLMVFYSCAVWFAVPLLWFSQTRLLDAMQMSLAACKRNVLPLLVLALVAMVLVIVAVIPFGLGLLVAFPVLLISNYTSFRQIFVD